MFHIPHLTTSEPQTASDNKVSYSIMGVKTCVKAGWEELAGVSQLSEVIT